MALFPLFIDLKEKNVIIIGGGNIASRKIKSLLPFKANIVVVADKVSKFITSLFEDGTVALLKKKFEFSDLSGQDVVIVAVDDIELQKNIYEVCKSNNVAVNCVDNPLYCSFIFPSLIVNDDLVIGISTSTKAPAVSKQIRKMIEGVIPNDVGIMIDEVDRLRQSSEKGRLRQDMIKQIVSEKFRKIQQK